jgi:peptidoglycan/xylan/chitin deacetylase (PgdA/CDA1 family)
VRRPGRAEAERLHTAALVFDADLAAGTVTPADLRDAPDLAGLAPRRRPGRAEAVAQRVADKLTGRDVWDDLLQRRLAVRRAVLGERAEGMPRLLLRVDEFPHAAAHDDPRYGTSDYRAFHDILAEAGIPYLVAVVPRPCHAYLSPRETLGRGLGDDEVRMLADAVAGGAALGLHALTHRTRHASPRRHSELTGLGADALRELIDTGLGDLREACLPEPGVFVAPFNRFDASRFGVLAERFPVVTGGPESVAIMGRLPTPVSIRGTVYLPSYPPLYGRAEDVARGLLDLERRRAAVWAPAVLHWGAERDDGFRGLRAAIPVLRRTAVPWDDLLRAATRWGGYATDGTPR